MGMRVGICTCIDVYTCLYIYKNLVKPRVFAFFASGLAFKLLCRSALHTHIGTVYTYIYIDKYVCMHACMYARIHAHMRTRTCHEYMHL